MYLHQVRGIHQWPMNSPYKGPVTQKKRPLWGFFHMGPHLLSNKQLNDQWFETTRRSCDVIVKIIYHGLGTFSVPFCQHGNSHWGYKTSLWASYLHSGNSSSTIGTVIHDDVIKKKHFPRYWPFVRGIHRSPVNSPHKGQWRGALMFSLICVWING